MRRSIGLPAVVVLAAGCMGGGSHHATLSANDALAQARKDGFVRPMRDPQPASWRCDGRSWDMGPAKTSGRYADYVRPSYVLGLDDERVPSGPGMLVIVLPNESIARRCAKAGIYQAMHIPVDPSNPLGFGPPYRPSKLIDSTTVETAMHAPGAPGFASPEDTGEYDTWVANGRVLGLGIAYNVPHSKIVREDLERLTAEIAG